MNLRDYQVEDLGKIKAKYEAGVTRQLCKQATGLGKTVMFSALPQYMGFTGRMMVLVHRDELAQQAANKLKNWNPGSTVGIEMGDSSANCDRFVVASVQTLGRQGSSRLEKFHPEKFDALVIDEAHHATAQTYRRIIDWFQVNDKLLTLGVTATPNRSDGKGLGEIFQEITCDRDILFGIRNNWLADLRGVRVKTGVDLSAVKTQAGDFELGQLGSTVNTTARNELIARAWLECAKDRPTVMFAVDVQHAKDLAGAFKRYGVASEAIWGGDPDRAAKLSYHRSGALKVLMNCQLLTEGYDDPNIACIGIARPTQSEGLYTQMTGRGTRLGDDGIKKDCLLLDFVDATSKHSLVTLPTLFGMGAETNLRGKAITKVVAEIEAAKKRNPLLDLSKVDDISNLQSYAEQVDLFKVNFPPEIIQLSEYQWHKTGENAYVLALLNNEGVAVKKDILDRWHIIGTVNEYKVNDVRDSFEEAIREADFKVGLLGGRAIKTLIKREASWHKAEPTPAQRTLCKRLRISIPTGATKGEVAMKLTQEIQRRKEARIRGVA